MKRTIWTLGIVAMAIVIGAALGRPQVFSAAMQENKAAEITVKIDSYTFSPGTLNVPAGTTVRWTNHDEIPLNVVSQDKSFKSKAMDTNENFSYTFATPGTYSYFCSIHPRMTGKIIVQ
ncbi:MAG TPA: cupredoxin family copper-binding protein [Candidatus Angelobacter sp.]|nr:cupredoxin family copper-binding protein [Candidatus Angelobacter sp.]